MLEKQRTHVGPYRCRASSSVSAFEYNVRASSQGYLCFQAYSALNPPNTPQSIKMSYTDDAVLAKLSTLVETQDSIVTVAQWIMFHRYVVSPTPASPDDCMYPNHETDN